MITKNRIEVKFEGLDKCEFTCDHDCSLGNIYDFACSLKHFIHQKMLEEQEKDKPQE